MEDLVTQVARLTHEFARLSRLEARARRLAYRDALTGLSNRRVLLDRLRQAIAQSTRHERHIALLMIDVDGFKNVNDRLGHTVGDALLQAVAERLVECVRAGDTVCRYGGDEFVVLLPEIANRTAALAAERKIRIALSEEYEVVGCRITEKASIGTAVFPADGRNARDLIAHADSVMYRAKSEQRSSDP
jgi:diguanylate cyclase